ncbi:ankyrin repeat and SOCS box protein 13-like [Actinia tenebrosa]|uniref:Ankyrin repeat and SOCS box protein 13-like n=1 Tax=Actinia tenebrosa TaxID=6105 RepID=A0A6P8ICS3_ACTTE|nr:ankyrin repeat and SOCS box protein 13-like [Actinia tenebrosa]
MQEAQNFDNFLNNYLGRQPPSLSRILNSPNETGLEQFLTAIKEGDIETAKLIYTKKKLQPNVCHVTSGETGLHLAAREGHFECVEFLLKEGADINLLERRGKSALHLAASNKKLEVVKLLLKYKPYLDKPDKYGRTPLLWATQTGNQEMIETLLDAGASLTTPNSNWHPLHEACKYGHQNIIKMLVKLGSPVNNPSEYKGCTPWSPLHIATRSGYLECIDLLLDAGADVHGKNAGGHTALHEAAFRGFSHIVDRLLHYNARPNAQNNQKRTPLHEACQQGKVLCAILLLDAGSKPNAQDMVLDTPLHHALRAKLPPPTAIAIITLLLQYGASPTIRGNNDDTPFDIIRETGQRECMDTLMEALENPQPLLQLCKVCIRRKLRFMSDLEKIDCLPLPVSVKHYLKEDVELEGDEN